MRKTAWIFSDGKAGHENQSIGIAHALGLDYTIIPLERRTWGAALSVLCPIWKVKTTITPPFPDVVIGTGGLTSAATEWVKKQAPHVFAIQVMTPLNRFGIKTYRTHHDVIVCPAHERPPAQENIVVTTGAPNKITQQVLTAAKAHAAEILPLPTRKRIAVLVGGTSKRFTFDDACVDRLIKELKALQKTENAELLITTSRRTGAHKTERLQKAFSKCYLYTPDSDGENPFMALLATADALVVTAESTSMVSEACTTGKPVYLFGLDDDGQHPDMGKFNRFYKILLQEKRAWLLQKPTETNKHPQEPLNDTEVATSFIRKHLLWTSHS